MKRTFSICHRILPRAYLAVRGVLIATTLVIGSHEQAQETSAPSGIELPQRVRDLVHGMENVPLPLIIEALSGREVLPWTGDDAARLKGTAAAVLARINAAGIKASRVNEAGNLVERHVLAALEENGFTTGRPAGASGRGHAASYPDLEAARDNRHYYVEVKSFSSPTIDSTQRTFYLSPSADFKVTRDAVHLLIAVELVAEQAGRYRAQSVRWLDLSRLRCDLKHEFNASNRDLYDPAQKLEIMLLAAPDE